MRGQPKRRSNQMKRRELQENEGESGDFCTRLCGKFERDNPVKFDGRRLRGIFSFRDKCSNFLKGFSSQKLALNVADFSEARAE